MQKIAVEVDQPAPLWQWLLPPALISIIGFLFYLPSVRYNFQFDDLASIHKFFNIRHNTLSNLFFHCSRWISYWLNSVHYSIGKFNPFSYRLFNITLHITTSILIFYLLMILLSQIRKQTFFSKNKLLLAFSTAALFALHPVQTQTVSYVIQGQLEGLACFFMVLMSLIFIWSQLTKNAITQYGLIALLFAIGALSCGSKEIVIVTPLLLLLIDWFFIAQGDYKKIIARWWIYVVLGLIITICLAIFLRPAYFFNILSLKHEAINNIGNVLTEKPSDKIRSLPFFISQFKVILHYLFIFIWPFNISVEYDWVMVRSFFDWDCILPFFFLCGITAVLYSLLRKDKLSPIVFGALWFFIVLAPRSTIIPSSELMSDYKTYGGSMGLLLLLAAALIYGVQKLVDLIQHPDPEKQQYLKFAVITLSLIPVGVTTLERNKVWRSGIDFWENILKNAPDKARAYNNYGVALSEAGRFADSIPYYLKAIKMDQQYPDPVNNVAVAYAQTGNIDKGIQFLKESIRIQPNYPEGYNNLASFFIQKGEYDQAEKMLAVALHLRPHYGKAYYNLGKLHFSKGNMEKAYEAFKAACTKADLDNEAGFDTFAKVCMNMGKFDEAIAAYQQIIKLNPSVDNIVSLANALHLANKLPEALTCYTQAQKLNPADPRIAYNIGETYSKLNKPREALQYFFQAKQLNYNQPNLPLRVAWCMRMLGRTEEATSILNQMLSQQLPENIKTIAQNELNAIKQSTLS